MSVNVQRDVSIHAYFSPAPPRVSTTSLPGDGFTSQEVFTAVKSERETVWQPIGRYAEVKIGQLTQGPKRVAFMGRVANIYDIAHSPRTEKAAKGGVKLLIKDDTGLVAVRMWYLNQPIKVRLGSLVSVWTTHVSSCDTGSLASAVAPYFISIFPERDRSCHIVVHDASDDGHALKHPLSFHDGRSLPGLMTLENFSNGGHDVPGVKVIVVVKSVGVIKTKTRGNGSVVHSVMIHVHDESSDAILALYETSSGSPFTQSKGISDESLKSQGSVGNHPWRPGETVLLLQSPGWSLGSGLFLRLQNRTIVDVDPDIQDACWLRKWAARKRSRESVNPSFPRSVFDLNMLEKSSIRALFTIAELDECARAAPQGVFQGYLSVVLTELRLVDHFRRKILMSAECCNISIYANATESVCKSCKKTVELRLSPSIVGRVLDETASISTGKLLFSDTAWTQLFGSSPDNLLKLDMRGIRAISDRLLFCRLTLVFGWSGSEEKVGGRICVLDVRS